MWRAIAKALEIVPNLIGQLPADVRPAAAAAWLIVGLLCIVLGGVVVLRLVPLNGHWVLSALTIALSLVGLALMTAMLICVALVVIGAIRRFFGRL